MAKTYDVAVIGAGVFGAWTAHSLRRAGAEVLLVDGYGPGNSRASSGGESRIIRLGYGPDEIYTRSAQRSLELWQQLFVETQSPELFQRTGVLWLARGQDAYCEAVLATLQLVGAWFEKLDHDALVRKFPQIHPDQAAWGILEPDTGVLLARRAVQSVVARAREIGVEYLQRTIFPSPETHTNANTFVYACGPWLPKIFPELLGELIQVTRQEVFFFGVPAGDERFGPRALPAWIDFNDLVYGIPNLDGRGFKLAIDAHGPEFDPDTGERVVSQEGLTAARSYLARRMPLLADAPVLETRVCQYENTSNGDFLIDRHPEFENVWIVGGGSGHGFKHGPAVGEYVAAMIGGTGTSEPRFSLATKQKVHRREVY